MTVLRAAAWWVSGAMLFASAAGAQTAPAPSANLQCLARAPDAPTSVVYPPLTLERKEGGEVALVMTFDGPDQAPRISFDESKRVVDERMKDAASTYARHFRLPCMPATSEPVTLTQNYLFNPIDGRSAVAYRPRDRGDKRTADLLKCMVTTPVDRNFYPQEALRRNQQGVVVVRLRFEDATLPPVVTVLADAGSGSLASAVESHTKSDRLPCSDGKPVEVVRWYHFLIQEAERGVLRDADLKSFLGSVKGIDAANVYFDFNRMACPFDIRLNYRQPYAANELKEVGAANPERQLFLDWMTHAELDQAKLKTPQRVLNYILGQTTTLTVPCGVLTLSTQNAGGSGSR